MLWHKQVQKCSSLQQTMKVYILFCFSDKGCWDFCIESPHSRTQGEKQLPSGPLLDVTWGRRSMAGHTLAFNNSVWNWHTPLALTFHQPEHVTWFSRTRKDNPFSGKAGEHHCRLVGVGVGVQCGEWAEWRRPARTYCSNQRKDAWAVAPVMEWKTSEQIREVNKGVNSYCVLTSFMC